MRNSIKNIECGDHTYSMFYEGANLTEGGGNMDSRLMKPKSIM